jgi:hypothetical protein
VTGERTAKVWAYITAAHDGDGLVSLAALCRAAVRCLGVDGASVIAMSGLQVREPLGASDGLSAQLEELQFTTGDGPEGEDFALGVPVLIPDLESAAGRWPVFVPAAVAAGAQALFAVPLQAGAIQVGVLSMYRSQPGSLTAAQLADGLVLADIALHIVLDAAAGVSASPDYRPLEGLSDRRAEVHQAAGMISVQLGVELGEALARLRAYAFASSASLGDVADDVVNRRLHLDSDRASGLDA